MIARKAAGLPALQYSDYVQRLSKDRNSVSHVAFLAGFFMLCSVLLSGWLLGFQNHGYQPQSKTRC